ncbi:MAG: hypothetical protein H7Y04_16040 [Verrucomicrobia bacterium]|nr:hypothetical protein [Cytophagales bacterium]
MIALQQKELVEVLKIYAKRAIEFEEEGDEGVLYLVESNEGECTYLWNEQYLIPEDGSFPCHIFELYLDDNFKYAIEEKINCIGEKFDSIRVSASKKRDYFKDRNLPEDLDTEKKIFDEVLEELKMLPNSN